MQGLSDLLSKGEHEQHDPSLKHTAWPEAVVMMPSSSSKWASLRISRRFFCTTCLNKKGRGGIHCIPVHLGGSLIPMHIRNEQLSSRSPYQNITSSIIYKNMAFPAWAFWENCTVPKKTREILLMEEILHQLRVLVLSHYLQGLYIPGDSWGALNHQQYESTCIIAAIVA